MADPSPSETTTESSIQQPPTTVWGIVKRLGPGLIIAGSIVGSGELIATTAVGAEAGFTLLWLVIIGCVIKVFAQVELGRYALTEGKPTLTALNGVPGPRLRVNWIVWYWLVMTCVTMGQLGGIVGGVGQALSISMPLTESGRAVNAYYDVATDRDVDAAIGRFAAARYWKGEIDAATAVERLHTQEQKVYEGEWWLALQGDAPKARDDIYWAAIITFPTIIMLVIGRYSLVQVVSTMFVALFTFITIGNLIHLQSLEDWRVTWGEFAHGLSFSVPPAQADGTSGLVTALAAFGIIGVGATELIQYPYWCMEKGYAKWAGPRDDSDEWAERANGWLRVMRYDAWASMLVYTLATAAFFLVGAAVLGRTGLVPQGTQLVRTLSQMYVPVFGSIAPAVFLFGAFAVLYSTFFVANASNARVAADAVGVFGFSSGDAKSRLFWVRVFCVIFPLSNLVVYAFVRSPKALVLASGVMQAIMLPMLGAAALYFRFKRCDRRVTPGRVWDIFLWLSFAGLLLAGGYTLFDKVSKAIG